MQRFASHTLCSTAERPQFSWPSYGAPKVRSYQQNPGMDILVKDPNTSGNLMTQ
jgi:hypothetical protein